MLNNELHRLTHQAFEEVGDFSDDVRKLEDLRAQGLLARESEQLPRQTGSAIGIVPDLLNVVIIAVARRMTHQNQVTMPQNAGEDVVEVMRDAAGKLPDSLHLGGLRDLFLEARFLAGILDRHQHGCFAQPFGAGDGQRDRFFGQADKTDCDIAADGLTHGISAHRICHSGFVFPDDEIARIDRL